MSLAPDLLAQLPDDLLGQLLRLFLGSDAARNLDRESVQAVGQFVGFGRQWLATADIVSVTNNATDLSLIMADGETIPIYTATPEPQRVNSYYMVTPPMDGKRDVSLRAQGTVNIFGNNGP